MRRLLGLLSILLVPAVAGAHGTQVNALTPRADSTIRDADLLAPLAEADLAQQRLAELALQKTQNEDVRTIAQRRADDSKSAYRRLELLALGQGLPFPSQVAGNQKLVYERIAQLGGDDFDRAYVAQVALLDHEATRAAMRIQARADNPAVRDHVARIMPTLRHQAAEASREMHRM